MFSPYSGSLARASFEAEAGAFVDALHARVIRRQPCLNKAIVLWAHGSQNRQLSHLPRHIKGLFQIFPSVVIGRRLLGGMAQNCPGFFESKHIPYLL